jgi:hypothetical protein
MKDFKVGLVYALPASLATLMIVEGWAEPMVEAADPALPPVKFHLMKPQERRRRIYTDTYLRTHLGLAADRRRRH